jgi:hypothetical protein
VKTSGRMNGDAHGGHRSSVRRLALLEN